VRTGGLGLGLRSVGPGEVRGIEALESSGPDFTDVTIPRASPSNVAGEGVEMSASTGSFVFSLHLEVAATLATIILKASSRQGQLAMWAS
jgi:hypothetical protein